jgi:beta-glucosidase
VTGRLHPTPSVVTGRPVLAGDGAAGISQRVYFPSGVSVLPQPTVSLSDESLYGFSSEGAAHRIPKAMTITYRSNRPSVVTVDRDGHIHTVGTGVATVTAIARYHGGTARGSFVIDVR